MKDDSSSRRRSRSPCWTSTSGQIFFGLEANYNFTDWLALGVWGALAPVKLPTDLANDIETVNDQRGCHTLPVGDPNRSDFECQLTARNVGPKFTEQVGTIDWVAAPQLTVAPFRGKIALFQSIYADTDLYIFAGAAIVGVQERAECGPDGADCTQTFQRESSVAIAPTFGLGLSFYVNKWNAFKFEWRGLPFARNTGGFDNFGGGEDGRFPDLQVNGDDKEFKFNNMMTIKWGFHLPLDHRVSE